MLTIWTNAARRAVLPTLAAMLLAIGLPAIAEAKPRSLTKETVRQFIVSYPEVRKIAVAHAAQTGSNVATADDGLMAVLQAVSDDSLEPQLDSAVRSHGFKSGKEWMSVAESVGRAYAHLKVGGGGSSDKAQRKLDKAVAKIEKNDFLSEKQKEKLIKALRKGADKVTEAPPEENIAAVKPMVADLEAVVK